MEDEPRQHGYDDRRYEAPDDYRGRPQPSHSYTRPTSYEDRVVRSQSRERQASTGQKYDDYRSPSQHQSHGSTRYDDQYGRPKGHEQQIVNPRYEEKGRYPGDQERGYPGPSGYDENRRREGEASNSKPDQDRYHYDRPTKSRTPPGPRHAPQYSGYDPSPRGRSPPDTRSSADRYRSDPPLGSRPGPDRYGYDPLPISQFPSGQRHHDAQRHQDGQRRGTENSWDNYPERSVSHLKILFQI